MENNEKDNQSRKMITGIIPGDWPNPHNLEAEKAVIAAMLRQPYPCVDTAIELLHNEEVFYSHIYREIFKAIIAIYNDTEINLDLSLGSTQKQNHIFYCPAPSALGMMV